jgi:hypothetical protein
MGRLDLFLSCQVGDGTGHLDEPVVGAGAQAECFKSELQQLLPPLSRLAYRRSSSPLIALLKAAPAAALPALGGLPDAGQFGPAADRTAWPAIFGSAAACRCIRARGSHRVRRDKSYFALTSKPSSDEKGFEPLCACDSIVIVFYLTVYKQLQ